MYKHASSLLVLWLYFLASHCIGQEITFDDNLYKQHFKTKEEILDYLSGKTIKTKRLSISFTTEKDIDQLAPYFLDEPYLRMYNMFSVWPKNIQEAKEHLQKHNTNDLRKCFFTIKLEDKCIGQLGFSFSTPRKLWVCYWLAKKHQRQRYMSEICLPMVKFFFETCEEFSMLHISVHKDNTPSKKLAQKICSFITQNLDYASSVSESRVSGKSGDTSVIFTTINYFLQKKSTEPKHQNAEQTTICQRLCFCC